MNQYDVIIIGGGVAGYYSSILLSKGGKKVALIEKDNLGGTSLRWGALPVKKILDSFKKSTKSSLEHWKKDLKTIENRIEKNLKENKVDIYYGEGKFLNENEFQVGEKVLHGEYIIIATGTRPSSFEEIPLDDKKIITHKEAIDLDYKPKSIIILGGNVEGIEFGAFLGEMGIDVTIVEKENAILSGNDKDLIEPIENHLLNKGVRIIKGIGAKKAYADEDKTVVLLDNGTEISAEKVLVTLKRESNFPKGLLDIGIKVDENKIRVYENLKTNIDNIFAIGDINGILGMAHVAIHQGIKVAEYILYNKEIKMDYSSLPRATFTLPEMAGAGYQENQLILDNIPYKKGYCSFANTWRGWAKNIEEGFVKILLGEDDTLLGIWMVGEQVSEYIGLLGLLLNKKVTAEDIKSNLIVHPTLAESILEAVLSIE